MLSSAPLTPDRPSLSLGGLLAGARTRWISALALGIVLAGGLGAAVWVAFPAEYSTSLLLQFRFGQSALADPDKGVLVKEELENQQRTQLAVLRNPRVLETAVKNDACRDLPTIREQPDPAGWLGRELKAGFYEGSPLMWVSLSGPRGADLAPILNAVGDAFTKEVAETYRRELNDKIEQLVKAIADSEQQAIDQRNKVARLMGPVPSDPRVRAEADALVLLKAQYARSQIDAQRHKDALERLQKRLAAVDTEKIDQGLVDEIVDGSLALHDLTKELQQARKALETAQKVSGAGSPTLAKYQEAVDKAQKAADELRKELNDKAVARIRTRARAEFTLLVKREEEEKAAAETLVADLKNQVDQAPTSTTVTLPANIEVKRAAIEQVETVLAGLRVSQEKLRIEQKADRPRVTVQQDAAAPGTPNVRAQAIRAGAAGLSGLVVGILIVGLMEVRSRRLRYPDQVIGTGLRVLGAVPAVSRRALAGGAPLAPWNVALGISLDLLRTTLQLDNSLRRCRSIVVTSAVEAEGKSSLATLLAVSLARAGFRTLLVDADLRYPDLHEKLKLPMGTGLSEVLTSQEEWPRAIQQMDGLPLGVMTAGTNRTAALGRLSRVNLKGWIASMRQSWSYIIIDTPPILRVPEAAIFGKAADGVLVCARAGASRVEEVTAAVRRLTSLGANGLGMVLNGVRGEVHNYPAEGVTDGPMVVVSPPSIAS
jgi:polysaccharide biosynthesis transport protein